MTSPLILVNLKTYREGMGNRAHQIATAAQLVARESGVVIGVAPGYIDLHPLCHHFAIPVYAQHVDGSSRRHTGQITADALKLAGAAGSLVNHSERRLTLAEIESSVRALQSHKLAAVVCSNNEITSAGAAALGPEYVAIEPPELIGSGVSVSKANPDIYPAVSRGGPCGKPEGESPHGRRYPERRLREDRRGSRDGRRILASSVVKAPDPVAVFPGSRFKTLKRKKTSFR